MFHSITFGTKNTWDDWHLIPSYRPVVNPPQLKENYESPMTIDGDLDLTTVLTGQPTYRNRTGSFEFYAENGFQPWAELYSKIMTALHGQRMSFFLEDDPDYEYEGRLSVDEWRSDKQRSVIIIGYNADPFKMNRINGTMSL